MEIRKAVKILKGLYSLSTAQEQMALGTLITFAEEALNKPQWLFIAELQSRINELEKPSDASALPVGVEEVIEVLADCKSKWIEDKAQALLKEFNISRREK